MGEASRSSQHIGREKRRCIWAAPHISSAWATCLCVYSLTSCILVFLITQLYCIMSWQKTEWVMEERIVGCISRIGKVVCLCECESESV